VKRGSINFYIDPEVLKHPRKKKRTLGRPRLFSHPLIKLLLILKIQYRLPYRALEGFAKSALPDFAKDLILPSYSVICRRAKELEDVLPKLSSRRPHTILLDASGIKVYGEGEWKVKVHGKTKRRKWIKIHIAVDEATQEIVAMEMTDSHVADCTAGSELINCCPKSVKIYKTDGAYDTSQIRTMVQHRRASCFIPPRRNARYSKKAKERNASIAEMNGCGRDGIGRSLWGQLTGYSKRALVETSFSRLKKIYGPSFFSREKARQSIEGRLKCWMLNEMVRQSG